MNRCAECNFPLDDGLPVCPQCGANNSVVDEEHGTIDMADGNLTVDEGQTELDEADDFEFDEALPTLDNDASMTVDAGDATRATLPHGFGAPSGDRVTVNAFGMPDDPQAGDSTSDPNATHVLNQEAATSDADADRLTVDMADDPQAGDKSSDSKATHVLNQDAGTAHADADRLTIDMADEGRRTHYAKAGQATVDSGEDSAPLPGMGTKADGPAKTVALDSGDGEEAAGDRTLIYESTMSGSSTMQVSSASGTEGRLKRLWEGVAGSSVNPMHSLQAIGLQASESIFQRVATRRVADTSAAGDMIADYQIVDKLGEGAMGIVFSARQTAVNRIVAIKTAKPNFQSNDESRRRFLYEAHITADLDHSNIVPIHELGASEEGMLFYSMKLVQGTEWSQVMRKQTREKNLEIFMKVCDAMAFAHSKGVIHRDLKPENTMLGRFGEVFVTDWGTAINLDKDTTYLAQPAAKGDRFLSVEDSSNLVRGDSIVLHDGTETYDRAQIVNIDEANPNRLYLRKKLTRDYQPSKQLRVVKAMNLAGTPCYMAPEMAGHQLPKIGKTSDVYILGAILFDLVTGKPPHTGASVTHCLRAALENKPVTVVSDDPLMKIALRAMATDPAARYQSVEELQEAVREYRRHAESIALTERSDELLEQAIAKKDYAAFSRAMFGYSDALDLWPDNSRAESGLKKARLSLGQAAFAQGDFDLVLQSLKPSEPEELELIERASAAKKKAESREASVRLLQKVVAAVVLLAIVGLSTLAWMANNQKNLAVAAQEQAEVQQRNAERAAEQEKEARGRETLAKEKAQQAQEKETLAKLAAQKAERTATSASEEAKRHRSSALSSAINAAKQEWRAKQEQVRAEEAAVLAQRRSTQIQLGEYNSSLALAKSQIESFDPAAAARNLQRLSDMFGLETTKQDAQSNVFLGNTPQVDSWGWQRIELLGNFDLPKVHIGASLSSNDAQGNTSPSSPSGRQISQQVSASAYAPQSNQAVVGTKDGLVQLLKYEAGELQTTRQVVEADATIVAVAISPNGQEVVYSYVRRGQSGVNRWDVSQATTQPVVATQKRSFQYFCYSLDGQQLIGGISGGVWVWDCDNEWYSRAEPKFRVSLRGQLTNLQSIDSQHTLLTTRFQDQQTLVGILDHASQAIQLVESSERLPAEIRSAVHTLVDDQIVLGLANNRLMVGELAIDGATITNLVELVDKHRAPVTAMVSNGVDRLITSSQSEPVVHVWRYAAELGIWEYDTYLTGTPNNIAGVGLLGGEQVMAVDAEGTSIVWNVDRQKQRRRMQRSTDGQMVEYLAPVQAVIAGPSDGQALAIDSNGVVDLWSLADGHTLRIDGSRWSYIGHTPGAELVNSAIDHEQSVVVTAASLKNADKKYSLDPTHVWEFCSWDAHTGSMLRRWTATNREVTTDDVDDGQTSASKNLGSRHESIEQRISLVDSGRQLLFASDSETRLIDLATGEQTFRRGDFGSYFAVPHPVTPGLTMLVKRSGAVRLFDVNNAASWDAPAMRNFSLADPSDIPLQGVWSNSGRRFYLSFSTGALAAFQWNGADLSLQWSTRSFTASTDTNAIHEALSVNRGRIQSQLDVDMAIEGVSGNETLHIATRRRGASPSTKLVSLLFSDQESQPELLQSVEEAGVRWLQVSDEQPARMVDRIHDSLVIDSRRVRSRMKLNSQTFVTTSGANVLELTDGSPEVTSFGRTGFISATGNQQGTALWILLEDGAIWNFTTGSQSGNWLRMGYTALGASRIMLSPDEQQMLIFSEEKGTLVDAKSGLLIEDLGALRGAAWDPAAPARLAVCRTDGSLEIIAPEQTIKLPARPLMSIDASLVQLSFFNETWADPTRRPRQFLLVHSETADKGAIEFVPIDPAPEDAPDSPAVTVDLPLHSRVAVSPTENILVTGAPGGTVTVWFAAPSHDPKPRQLFNLEGHRGEQLTCVTFSSDGRTLITADTKNRLYAWLSRDPLLP